MNPLSHAAWAGLALLLAANRYSDASIALCDSPKAVTMSSLPQKNKIYDGAEVYTDKRVPKDTRQPDREDRIQAGQDGSCPDTDSGQRRGHGTV
ncbi:hypothetical protein WMY93_017187 [Mugilogobius chulae]|uniref:Uncharacterized protein n=1 Tax=Mugilogobius chulae TaxID=88201 RepID=A0AAW0NSB8_9GOBI